MNSGIFRNSIKTGQTTNQTQFIIKAVFGDTIVVLVPDTPSINDHVKVTVPSPPLNINSLRFVNQSFSEQASDITDVYQTLYIELTAADLNPFYADTASVIVQSTYDSIIISLKETNKHTGFFHGSISLNDYSFALLNIVKAYRNGDTVVIRAGNEIDTITIFRTVSPSTIVSIVPKTDLYISNRVELYALEEEVLIEVAAIDANPNTTDTIQMVVYANRKPMDKVYFTLIETTKNSNIYRGKFRLTGLSNDRRTWRFLWRLIGGKISKFK